MGHSRSTSASSWAIEGHIGPTGVVRFEDIEPGECVVSFPRLDASAWEPAAGAAPR